MRNSASDPAGPRTRRSRRRVAPWVVALSLLAGCGGYADEFIGDTDMGRIRLRVALGGQSDADCDQGDAEKIIVLQWRPIALEPIP